MTSFLNNIQHRLYTQSSWSYHAIRETCVKTWNESRRGKKEKEIGNSDLHSMVTCRGLSAEWALAGRGGGHSWLGSPAAITSWYQCSKSSLGIWGLSCFSWPFTHIKTHRNVLGWNETRTWGKEEKRTTKKKIREKLRIQLLRNWKAGFNS